MLKNSQATIEASMLLDSRAPCGSRLSTFVIRLPYSILQELNTHRMLEKSAASLRAIPTMKLIRRVVDDPFMPVHWGTNQPGMQAYEELTGWRRWAAKKTWRAARYGAVAGAYTMHKLGAHKQLSNRLLSPWLMATVIISGTEWDNMFWLRTHKSAEPHFRELAIKMYRLYANSTPQELKFGEWHLPFITHEDWPRINQLALKWVDEGISSSPSARNLISPVIAIEIAKKVSTGRCARVSYETHDGKRDIEKDIELHDKLFAGVKTGEPLHSTPAGHQAMALSTSERVGPFIGWQQYRKEFLGEAGPVGGFKGVIE